MPASAKSSRTPLVYGGSDSASLLTTSVQETPDSKAVELPVDFVKIDHTVIAAALDDTHAQAVLLAIIAYAGRAGAYVIAEGIESEQILSFVHNAEDRPGGGPPIKGVRDTCWAGRHSIRTDRSLAGKGSQPGLPSGHARRATACWETPASPRKAARYDCP